MEGRKEGGRDKGEEGGRVSAIEKILIKKTYKVISFPLNLFTNHVL